MTMKNLDAIRDKLEDATMKLVIRKGKAMSPIQLYVNAKSGTGIEINATDNTIRGCTRDDTGMVYDNLPARLVGFVNECKELAGIPCVPTGETPLGALSEDNQPEPAFDPPEEDCFVQDTDVLASPEKIMSQAIAKPPDVPLFAGRFIKNFKRMTPEIGAIKIGGMGKSKKGAAMPVKHDHFTIMTKHKDKDGNAIVDDAAMAIFGDNPKVLDIALPSDDPTVCLQTEYAKYAGRKRVCHGDGEVATDKDGNTKVCDTETCPDYRAKECKLNGMLSVFLPTVGRFGGVYKFRTTSFYSVNEMMDFLLNMYAKTDGILTDIPLKLTVTPRSVNPVGSATAQTVFIVNILYDGTEQQMMNGYIDVSTEKLRVRQQLKQISEMSVDAIIVDESEEEQAAINAEYYPKTVDEEV